VRRTGPGSFIEVRKILPLLVQTSEDGDFPSFHVVAFSLPGYGFSEGAKKPGFTTHHYAEVSLLSLKYRLSLTFMSTLDRQQANACFRIQ
jgi:pimeloyl-ACP methyl ester carboxylesterase